jgi:hypothetical protein
MRTATRLGISGLLFSALIGALASGCASTGGQTGDEEQAPCWSKITALALDAKSPLGFSAQDSLNLAAGEHTATLHWIAATYPYGPESADGALQVTIASLGSAHFATREAGQAFDERYCPPSVLTDVSVEFDSAGGAFHESFQGVLAASMKDSATLTATLLGDHLAGSFAFDEAALGDRNLAQIALNLSFNVASFSGALNAGIQQAHGDGANSSVSLENVPLACWGSAALPGQAACTE